MSEKEIIRLKNRDLEVRNRLSELEKEIYDNIPNRADIASLEGDISQLDKQIAELKSKIDDDLRPLIKNLGKAVFTYDNKSRIDELKEQIELWKMDNERQEVLINKCFRESDELKEQIGDNHKKAHENLHKDLYKILLPKINNIENERIRNSKILDKTVIKQLKLESVLKDINVRIYQGNYDWDFYKEIKDKLSGENTSSRDIIYGQVSSIPARAVENPIKLDSKPESIYNEIGIEKNCSTCKFEMPDNQDTCSQKGCFKNVLGVPTLWQPKKKPESKYHACNGTRVVDEKPTELKVSPYDIIRKAVEVNKEWRELNEEKPAEPCNNHLLIDSFAEYEKRLATERAIAKERKKPAEPKLKPKWCPKCNKQMWVDAYILNKEKWNCECGYSEEVDLPDPFESEPNDDLPEIFCESCLKKFKYLHPKNWKVICIDCLDEHGKELIAEFIEKLGNLAKDCDGHSQTYYHNEIMKLKWSYQQRLEE